jgi:maltooligosyltrehalose trehalohydrolase
MIELSEVGAFPAVTALNQYSVRFGLYLPGIRANAGFDVVVRVIHADDRFDPEIPTTDFHLTWKNGHPLDLWTVTTPLIPVAGMHIGLNGTHLYRFELWWTPAGGTPATRQSLDHRSLCSRG